MHLSKNDRKQMVEEWLQSLPSPLLLEVSKRLLFDVKSSHDRLNQNPSNSLRPPSSQAPWDKPSSCKQKAATPVETPDPRPAPAAEEVAKHPTAEDDAAAAPDQTTASPTRNAP